MVGNVKRVTMTALLLALVVAALAGTASARPTAERGNAIYGRNGLYAQEQRARMRAEARFYASTQSSTDSGSTTLGYALVACLLLLAGAGAAAAWRFERRNAAPLVAALRA
jgi:hypothetical protein